METVQEILAAPPSCNNYQNDLSPIAKGKRTKRHRIHSPVPFTAQSPNSDDSTTTEEEDTARCLILLAQGGAYFPPQKFTRIETTTTARTAGGGACMYTCKTCNRAFSSFQALGGHRASHKKPKNEKKSSIYSDEEDFPSPASISSFKNRLSLQLNNISTSHLSGIPKSSPSPRIHECSYCGAEFTSGQALGGHMRRHRGSGQISPSMNPPSTPTTELNNTAKNVLSLDLNLPAPEDHENQRLGFEFSGSKQQKSPEEKKVAGQGLVLSTTATTPIYIV